MKIILITHLDLPVSIRHWLGKHYIADAVGALEVLKKAQQQLIDIPDDLTEDDINEQIISLEHLLTQGGYAEPNIGFEPPPMGVVMPDNIDDSLSTKKDDDNE